MAAKMGGNAISADGVVCRWQSLDYSSCHCWCHTDASEILPDASCRAKHNLHVRLIEESHGGVNFAGQVATATVCRTSQVPPCAHQEDIAGLQVVVQEALGVQVLQGRHQVNPQAPHTAEKTVL